MKEEDIRPKQIFSHYLKLSRADADKLDVRTFKTISCPGCDGDNSSVHIIKHNYKYLLCADCGSLFCSPRPSEKQLHDFYVGSESSSYWTNVFFPTVIEVRREKLFKPKSIKIVEYLNKNKLFPKKICDVGIGHGIFLEELRKIYPDAEYFGIEPSMDMANICKKKGFNVLNTTAENSSHWENKFDFVICSEVIEHVFSPNKFICSLKKLLMPDGLCLVTGLGYEGYDILSLQDKSSSISPPHHINFLSIDGLSSLFKRQGFISVDIQTPGELDLDIVMKEDSSSEWFRVLKKRGENALKDFQEFLQNHKISSHVWIWGKSNNKS